MWVEETVLHVWGMRTLCEAGGSGPMLDLLMNLADKIEQETAEALAPFGIAWAAEGLNVPKDGSHRDALVGLEMTPAEIEALTQAYFGSQEVPRFVWRQGLPDDFRRAVRSLGPALREWLEEARVEAQLERMPERVRARLVERAAGGGRGRIHPATKTFQALRMAVNEELDNLDSALRQAISLLGSSGRIVVISFHSLEDRLVKSFFRRESQGCLCPTDVLLCACGHVPSLKVVSRKAIRPSETELAFNPRSRSAKMRVAERI